MDNSIIYSGNLTSIQPIFVPPSTTVDVAEQVFILRKISYDIDTVISSKVDEAEALCESEPDDDYALGELAALKRVRNVLMSEFRAIELAIQNPRGQGQW